jgi:hypothetical protein
MVEYCVTVKLNQTAMDLFNADIKQFSLNYPTPVDENRIKEDLFKKIPECLVDSFKTIEITTINVGDVMCVHINEEDNWLALYCPVVDIDCNKNTFTVKLSEYNQYAIQHYCSIYTGKRYKDCNSLSFKLYGDGWHWESSCRKKNLACARLATDTEVREYNTINEELDNKKLIDAIIERYFVNGFDYNQYCYTSNELGAFIGVLKSFLHITDDEIETLKNELNNN